MARRRSGPARQRNARLIRELDRICRKKDLTVHGRPDYRALSKAAGMSESGLEGITKRNAVPMAETLILVARAAGESPLWLMLAAWEGFGFGEEDVAVYLGERDASLVPHAVDIEGLSSEGLAGARRGIEGILYQLDQLEDAQSAQPGEEPPLHPATPAPEDAESE